MKIVVIEPEEKEEREEGSEENLKDGLVSREPLKEWWE